MRSNRHIGQIGFFRAQTAKLGFMQIIFRRTGIRGIAVRVELLTSIAAKKERLEQLRPLSRRALANVEHYYDIELTYW